jgi:transcriptional regulator with XRE-family HTH domain
MTVSEWKHIIQELGITIRRLRSLVGWSQQKLADRAVMSQGAISRLESGHCLVIPLHSVITVMRTLAPALKEMGIEVSPGAQAMISFSQLPLEAQNVDPDLVWVSRSLREMTPRQREVFIKTMRPLVEFFVEARNDSQSVLLREHRALSVRVNESGPG